MNYDRVIAWGMESQAITTADDPLIELTAEANSYFDVLRVEVGPSEGTDPVDEIQEVALWHGTIAGSGGTGLTGRILNGEGTIVTTGDRNVGTLGTGNDVYFSAYHTQNGWLYLPIPEERIRCKAGGDDIFAVLFPTAPDASMTLSCTVVIGEVG